MAATATNDLGLEKPTVTKDELASVLRCDKRTIDRYLSTGKNPLFPKPIKIGPRKVLFLRSGVLKFMQTKPVPMAEADAPVPVIIQQAARVQPRVQSTTKTASTKEKPAEPTAPAPQPASAKPADDGLAELENLGN